MEVMYGYYLQVIELIKTGTVVKNKQRELKGQVNTGEEKEEKRKLVMRVMYGD